MTAELSVEDVMQAWPETLRVFLRRRMACVGCAVAPFHTVAEVARIYGVPMEALLHELRELAGAAAARKAATRGITPRRRCAPAHADRGSRSAGVPR